LISRPLRAYFGRLMIYNVHHHSRNNLDEENYGFDIS
jgi:hypothetical protein